MSEIDRSNPGACHFCSVRKDREIKALILPWPNRNIGYWHCKGCTEKAERQAALILEKYRVLSFKVLPHWFLEWGAFDVRRSDGALSSFELMNWKSDDKDAGCQLYLTKTEPFDIKIDMALSETHTRFKKVSLLSLYRENPSLWNQPMMELRFPSFIGGDMANKWGAAVQNAYNLGQELMDSKVVDPTSLTDDESEEIDEPAVAAPPSELTAAALKKMAVNIEHTAAPTPSPPPSPTMTEPLAPEAMPIKKESDPKLLAPKKETGPMKHKHKPKPRPEDDFW